LFLTAIHGDRKSSSGHSANACGLRSNKTTSPLRIVLVR
jgi:hypothetical protein